MKRIKFILSAERLPGRALDCLQVQWREDELEIYHRATQVGAEKAGVPIIVLSSCG